MHWWKPGLGIQYSSFWSSGWMITSWHHRKLHMNTKSNIEVDNPAPYCQTLSWYLHSKDWHWFCRARLVFDSWLWTTSSCCDKWSWRGKGGGRLQVNASPTRPTTRAQEAQPAWPTVCFYKYQVHLEETFSYWKSCQGSLWQTEPLSFNPFEQRTCAGCLCPAWKNQNKAVSMVMYSCAFKNHVHPAISCWRKLFSNRIIHTMHQVQDHAGQKQHFIGNKYKRNIPAGGTPMDWALAVCVQALPFLIETPTQKAHKTSLERRLQEIEEANKVFSRTKVLVEIWSQSHTCTVRFEHLEFKQCEGP